ncbi:DUF5829 family protein [Actinokineospora spheciospongiae]|uniref:DUF5829 family protein n=1 Tax=Actinokineospora spheciospongiae TaxID=909613 RepID=UPI000D714BAA|nr:DUF5829 family protein [Actinokineospora spheciospongiae]PWW62467.1 hypothetical protein DFQ13_105281 [Actinokineospora spheciospongiae]
MTRAAAAVDNRPVPRLDHVMVLLDAETHRSIEETGFLAERLGRIKVKKADSSVAGQYSTLGIAGRSTLVELFGAEMPGSAPLSGGLVFSFEEPGSSPGARALLDATGTVRHHHDLVRRVVEGHEEPRPWYHLINVDLGAGNPLLLFLNEVTPEYFASLGAVAEPDGAMRRAAYLDAVLGRPADPASLLRDISGVTLLVGADRAAALAAALAPFGWVPTEGVEGTELVGPGLTIGLRVGDWPRERVAEIHLDLEPGAWTDDVPAELVFGPTSRLVFTGPTAATWHFA